MTMSSFGYVLSALAVFVTACSGDRDWTKEASASQKGVADGVPFTIDLPTSMKPDDGGTGEMHNFRIDADGLLVASVKVGVAPATTSKITYDRSVAAAMQDGLELFHEEPGDERFAYVTRRPGAQSAFGTVVRTIGGRRVRCDWHVRDATIRDRSLAAWPTMKKACDSITLAEEPAPTASAAVPSPADDEATALAAKPKQRAMIDRLGVSIEVPEGTTVSPARDADSAKRQANLKNGAFMVNVWAVDEFSTPNFAKAKEVYTGDKLVEWFRADETPTGWIIFKEVVSGMHKSSRFEVEVRSAVGGKKWDCSISAPSKPLAELALAACQTLSAGHAPEVAAPVATETKPAAKPAAARATTKAQKPSVQGALNKDAIARVVRRETGKARRCYERALMKNPKLSVTVTTAFEINASGKVSSANSMADDKQLAACVAAVFKGMQFPAPADGRSVRISYPFRFAPDAK